ncbi:MAG: tRNA pseudouridine(55) synthase TruB [Malacoplasma sp.]
MENIIVLNKPKGITSHDAISIYKKNNANIKKIGHAGTLDPNASGVLVVGINSGTKKLAELILDDKEYIATIKLGMETSTYDSEGDILFNETLSLQENDIKNVIDNFNCKKYWQTPPIYSAIKIKGKKLYEYARKDIAIEIPPREVEIKCIEILSFDLQSSVVVLKMLVSKGFYIRSFAMDFAEKLNTKGTLTDLIRTKSGKFTLDDAKNLI